MPFQTPEDIQKEYPATQILMRPKNKTMNIRATLYTLGGFGTSKREITLHEIKKVDYAQYKNIDALVFTEKRKKSKCMIRASESNPDWLVIEGWGQPEAPSGFEKCADGMMRGISSCYGHEYETQFAEFTAGLKKTCKVIFDGKAIQNVVG